MEDFVSFEIAKKLKEKDFNEPCLGFYYPNGNLVLRVTDGVDDFRCCLGSLNKTDNIISNEFFDAPTISQVLKWLFNEKQLFVNIDCNICDKFGLFFTIHKKGEETWEVCGFDENYYNRPEEASLAGIEYVLNNLI